MAAPGVGVTSSVGRGWLTFAGTSMASPHVAGVVALMAEANPALRGREAADVIRRTASDRGPAGPDPRFGNGALDAEAAVADAAGVQAAAAPETRFARTPGRFTRRDLVAFDVEVRGASRYRWRVGEGGWSAPTERRRLVLRLPEGRHRVQAQAWDPAGGADVTPAGHVVVVDRTPPRLSVEATARRGRVALRARARSSRSPLVPASVRWRLPGVTARGMRAEVPVRGGARTIRVQVSAADRAGNRTRVVRTLRLP